MFVFPTEVTLFRKVRDPINPERFLKDEYSRFILSQSKIMVACSLQTNVTKDRDGVEVTTFLDVDIPSSVELGYGDEISYTDSLGNVHRGEIKLLGENTDPFGIKVYSRYASIG